ncbi:MAG: glycerol-3-phosphate dehydrogenase/oxidase, partial [Candidatus Sericytochromatia bacterium]|nr:glycerol-3-phosphate dehydrogenase/oxidase [Candidatus Tanganyikabacteria bacterium]
KARLATLRDMAHTRFDILVVGGGISGAGIALEAASRGLKTALVERNDYASGTSSKSSKLLHGGLRYLEQFRFGLVGEALHERNLLFDQVPHLARELPFIYPVEQGRKLTLWQAELGVTAYDALSALTGCNVKRWHRSLSPQGVRDLEPCMTGADLAGALRYIDGVTDDARLVLECVKAAVVAGARAVNHAPVAGFLRDPIGMVTGAIVRDGFAEASAEYEIHAHLVINAAGPWLDAVNRLDVPDAPRKLLPTKGIHVVVPSITREHALIIKSLPHADGRRRYMFVIPWGERSLIGTTDTANPGGGAGDAYLDDDAAATSEEVGYLLGSVNAACPGVDLRIDDVISAFAGWRPLVAPERPEFESDISRGHEIYQTPSGILSLAGGKLTTYRVMARQVVERAIKRLKHLGVSFGPLRPPGLFLPYGSGTDDRRLPERIDLERRGAPTAAEARMVAHFGKVYGAGFGPVLDLAKSDSRLAGEIGNLSSEAPYWRAQVAFAVRHESALRISDILARRMRIQLTDGFQGLGCLGEVCDLAAREIGASLGWTKEQTRSWAEREGQSYEAEIGRLRSYRTQAKVDA